MQPAGSRWPSSWSPHVPRWSVWYALASATALRVPTPVRPPVPTSSVLSWNGRSVTWTRTLTESSEPLARCDLLRFLPTLRPFQAWMAARSSRRSSSLHVDPSSTSSMVVSTCFHRCGNSPTVSQSQVVNGHCSSNTSWNGHDEMSRADPPPSTADVLAVEDDLIRAIASSFGQDQLGTTISIAKVLDDALRADLRHRRRVETLEPVLRACREACEREPDNRERLDDVVEMLRVTAMAHSDAGRSAAANRLLDDATTLVDRSSQPQAHLARIESLRAGLSFEFGDLVAARSYATSAIDSARAGRRRHRPSHGDESPRRRRSRNRRTRRRPGHGEERSFVTYRHH